MSKHKLLVVWTNYYNDLAKQQLDSCLSLLDKSEYDYAVETVDAGTYEIPVVIQYYHHHNPYDGYLPLSLLLKGSTDHYEFILEHVKECFIQFAMNGVLIGNGIISAPSMELMIKRVENHERVDEAFRALDYLIRLKEKLKIYEATP
ncbi:MAG: 6,7-dimethyl-8-ribityllumazine synthase [Legionellales bacterium RIFCSPHIGHO2_12_FULL_42_9]|nr:MAG: 6,7-dimethyl-8-ribityllumazine synthase [Legionellales bacterium RIFCSPHIGHO2_12_FULL_42_9]